MNTKVNRNQNRIDRIDRICEAVSAWLDNEDGLLEQARERTIAEGLFRPHDVDHMLGQIRLTVTRKALADWVGRVRKEGGTQGSRAGSQAKSDSRKDADVDKADNTQHAAHPEKGSTRPKTLCLHAGNLPMVGLQDMIAVLLSGSVYYGKLSRNDPWLPDSLLQIIRQRMPDQTGVWSTRMEELQGIKAGRVLFAGSEASVDAVIRRVHELKLATEKARFLPRTARLSMAWLTDGDFAAGTVDAGDVGKHHGGDVQHSGGDAQHSDGEVQHSGGEVQHSGGEVTNPGVQRYPAAEGELYRQLVEAMLRYDGKGCRSVAVVISARELSACAGPLMDASEAWLRDHPPGSDEKPGVRYWKNYLRAVDKEVYEAGGHLITSEPDLMGKEGVICWLKGDEKEVARLAGHFGSQLQSVYVTRSMLAEMPDEDKSLPVSAEYPAAAFCPEPLDQAQSPPIDWRPDGTDVLRWLLFE